MQGVKRKGGLSYNPRPSCRAAAAGATFSAPRFTGEPFVHHGPPLATLAIAPLAEAQPKAPGLRVAILPGMGRPCDVGAARGLGECRTRQLAAGAAILPAAQGREE